MGLLQSLLPGGDRPARPILPGALPEGMKVGAWRVVRQLGSEGSAVVYLVRRWGRLHALKLAVRPGDSAWSARGGCCGG